MGFLTAAAAAVSAIGSLASGEAKKDAARTAGTARERGLKNAIGRIELGRDQAISQQQPLIELGDNAKTNFFDQFSTSKDFRNELYLEKAKTGDPMFDFLQKRSEQALNRQLAARGRFDSGAALEAHSLQNAAISFELGKLTDKRVQDEINNQFRLLDVGRTARNTVSNIQTSTATQLANLEQGIGNSQAQTAQEIGSAQAGAIGGVTGAITGGIKSALEYGNQASGVSNILGSPAAGGGGGNENLIDLATGTTVDRNAGNIPGQPNVPTQPAPLATNINTNKIQLQPLGGNQSVTGINVNEFVKTPNLGSGFGRATLNFNQGAMGEQQTFLQLYN